MTYYVLVFLASILFATGVILLKTSFISLAEATMSLLNIMLESSEDEQDIQAKLIRRLGKLLLVFGVFILLIVLTVGVSAIPIILWLEFTPATFQDVDSISFHFYVSVISGGTIPFIFTILKRKKDYSQWSILLHKMVLDNYNISKSLFELEKKLFKKYGESPNENFVIVSGLARSGTTALTNLLYQSEKFHSLSYANMPFLLAINLWRKVYRPGKPKLRQRAHGDNVMFGYNSIEALEEHFFKVFLKDEYIKENTLQKHEIGEKVYKDYLNYQSLLSLNNAGTTYLAKNNNLILRYESLRSHNSSFKIILLFRNPLDHSSSLLAQHLRFSKLQRDDAFTLDYMNWLGHHEFGLNHKAFDLDKVDLCSQYEVTSINYWLSLWISYYAQIISMLGDENLILVSYVDLLSNPNKLLAALEKPLKKSLIIDNLPLFEKPEIPIKEVAQELEEKSIAIYNTLCKHKIE